MLFRSKHGHNPSTQFDTLFYLDVYPDVAASELNPLIHYLLFAKGPSGESRDPIDHYASWISGWESIQTNKNEIQRQISELTIRPVFSLVVPVFNPDPNSFRAMLESVKTQSYPDWQLCIADDCSSAPHVRSTVSESQKNDSRITAVYQIGRAHV